MKSISSELAAHLAQEVTTLAQCWKVTRRDGVELGFTEHDVDIAIDGLTYMAASGFVPSSIESQASLAVDNLDIEGMLDDDVISEADIMAGRYDFAEIESFIVNYADLAQGKLILRCGWLGEVQLNKQHFVAEVRGLTQKLSQHIGELYSPVCRAKFADARCGVDVASYTVSGTISSASNNAEFTDNTRAEVAGIFDGGSISFTSGDNIGLSREVKFFALGGEIKTALPFPHDVAIGDAYEMVQGCNKTITNCMERYDNAINFRGEPHVPGIDKIMQTATTR